MAVKRRVQRRSPKLQLLSLTVILKREKVCPLYIQLIIKYSPLISLLNFVPPAICPVVSFRFKVSDQRLQCPCEM